MRLLPPALLPALLLAGCAGQVRDFIGPRATIVSPQLLRYGLDLEQSRCVAQRLATMLTPRQLRQFARAAGALRQGYYDPSRMTLRDLVWVARTIDDREIHFHLQRANQACGVGIPTAAAPPPPTAPAAEPAPRPPTWLNLGAAGSGQSIAIDAATLEQEGAVRTAWFRLTDPGAAAVASNTYLLRIDCAHRTINPRALRRHDAAGAVTGQVDYPENPLPVEAGTVMEIAWLSLCT
jgi:hypothetical protein